MKVIPIRKLVFFFEAFNNFNEQNVCNKKKKRKVVTVIEHKIILMFDCD